MNLNKQVAFVDNWKFTFLISIVLSTFIVFIMVFLQPFDTFQKDISFKTLKLVGYGLTVFFPILILHYFERLVYYPSRDWRLVYEVIYISITVVFISALSYVYQNTVFSHNQLSISYFFKYFLNFCIPFFPIVVPLLAYLRFRFGHIYVNNQSEAQNVKLKISGENKEDELTISFNQFIFAEAQQNYVSLTYLDNDENLTQRVFRSTFGQLAEQLRHAYQVHRSFIVNPYFFDTLAGNSRKRALRLKGLEKEIPVSRKYYEAIKGYLQSKP